ncbi:MAG: hypothetical protein LUD01_10470, partial [Clostridiales bacterium]|nr:hypothetical protein [Clostridiales bacterium]
MKKKGLMKKILNIVLVVALMTAMLPQSALPVQVAYASEDLNADDEAADEAESSEEEADEEESEAAVPEKEDSGTVQSVEKESETEESKMNESKTDEEIASDSAAERISDQAGELSAQTEAEEDDVTVQATVTSGKNLSLLSATPSLTATEEMALTTDGGSLASGSYYLEDNVTLTSNITIATGENVIIDLNGHKLTGTGSGSVITVNGALTLTDSETGGTVTGGSASNGGGVYVSDGTFTMSGGTISGNAATGDGGGVYVASSGKFTMRGGTISGNE